MSGVGAEMLQRRSMLHRWHRRSGAEFAELGDMLFVSRYAPEPEERLAAGKLGLCDLSTMPRIGVTGAGAGDWLCAQGSILPEKPNRATRQAGSDALARLSDSEYLLLGTRVLQGGGSPTGFPAWNDRPEQRVYVLPRRDSHCCLALTGDLAASVLSKLCAVDLRPRVFADGDVAQTTLARIPAIVVRHDLKKCICYLLMANSTAVEYVFEAMLDAMAEFNGKPIGLPALHSGEHAS